MAMVLSKRIAAVLAAFAIAAAACLLSWQEADAATLDRTGFSRVPADTVRIDYPLKIADASFSTTNSAFKVFKNRSMWGYTASVVAYDRATSDGQTLAGSFTLKWSDCGTDADGDSIDVTVTASNIRNRHATDDLWLLDDSTGLVMDATISGSGNAGVRMDVTTKVTKHGTSTPAAGDLLVAFVDIDVISDWSEQVTLKSGFGSKVWVPSDNFLSITNNATVFTATQNDTDTYRSGFVTTASTSGFTLQWQGLGCGTAFLMPFKVNEQSVTASAGTGGKISDPGKTYLRWKNNKTYTITPNAHYRVKDVKADGKSVGAVTSYTFKSVTGHHTIQATFEPLPKYTVKFVDGFGKTLSTQSVEEGAAAGAPADPTHDGWAFIGWDKDFSKITGNLTVTAKWEPVIAVRIPTLVACQIQRDGSVVAPGGYAIENLSPVPVELESASTSGMPSYGSYELTDEDGNAVHSYAGGADRTGSSLEIGIGEAAPLSWSVGDIVGEEAQELLYAALQGQASLCDVHFTFKEA